MTAVQADINAIRALNTAIDRYQYEQRQVFSAAAHEIESTRASLERKAEKWRLRLEQLEWEYAECQRRAASAAEHGAYVDCSGYPPAIADAKGRLADVLSWQSRAENEIAVYEAERSRFHECIEVDLRHAYAYLNDVIRALVDARATRIKHEGPWKGQPMMRSFSAASSLTRGTTPSSLGQMKVPPTSSYTTFTASTRRL